MNKPRTLTFIPHSMLYQTHHPLLFQFHPFTSSTTPPHFSTSSSSSSSPSLPLSPSSLSQAETEMECVEAALKSSFRKDTALKLSPQTFLEELSAFSVQNVVTSCDDFVVDDLLDFSHEEELFEEEPEQHHHGSVPEKQNETQEIRNPSSFNDQFPSLPTSELSVPDDDAANLEWLSHFVEDSFSEHTVSFPTGISTESGGEKEAEPGSQVRPCFRTPVPAKARSKRTRTGVRVWPVVSPSFPELSSSTSSSTTTTTVTPCSPSLSSPSSPVFVCAAAVSLDRVWLPPQKKAKVRPATEALPPRRCSHCGVQKTPQWRTGPLGAKTLCNACGVRFKSGRLLPEYRPACSPTFSSQLHSNHHRKVLEMRRKKEVVGEPVTGLAPLPVEPGF